MQPQQNNPFFALFEKRRLKVVQMHRSRREDLFNQSRKMLLNEFEELSLQQNGSETVEGGGEVNSQQGDSSSLNAINQFDPIMTIGVDQNQINNISDLIIEDKAMQMEKPIKGINPKGYSKSKNHKPAKNYAKILQAPSWMNIVPEQLTQFYCMARPNGKSGLLVFQEGWISIYDKLGRQVNVNKLCGTNENQILIKRVAQHLQGSILQIVFEQNSGTIFISDLIKWKQTIMSAQNFEFRYAWLLANAGQLVNCNLVNLKIRLLQYFLLQDQETLQKIYWGEFGYQKEGLLFVHKQSPYLHGYNHNVMIWKDEHTSKYPIDEAEPIMQNEQDEGEKKKPGYIYGTGRLSRSGRIYSSDGFNIGYINPAVMPGVTGGFIKYRITGIKFNAEPEAKQTQQADMQIEDPAQERTQPNLQLIGFQVVQYKRYGKADPLSRTIFQYRMRCDPLPVHQIAARIPHN